MSVGRAGTVALIGIEATDVTVEAYVGRGLPGFGVIGSSGGAAREAAERVRTALLTVDPSLARAKILVSLAPADLPKVGARYDLAMAVAVLVQRDVIPAAAVQNVAFLGELALDGSLRGVPGVLPSAYHLHKVGVRQLIVAEADSTEARSAADLEVVGATSLLQVVGLLTGEVQPASDATSSPPRVTSNVSLVATGESGLPGRDLSEVRGQHVARRALEIAATGGHHILLIGPPGCGKSMLAARLPGLLPRLTDEQAFVLAAVRSVAGQVDRHDVLDRRPPFGAPHHTISAAALLGGGSGIARPGQVSLATGGVLFLDELFEWSRVVLDALREPLEEGIVRVARSRATVVYPASVQLVCAANPCPCGTNPAPGGRGGVACDCAPEAIVRYRSKLSGPLADRLDLAPAVEPLRARDLDGPSGESTSVVRERVALARQVCMDRGGVPATRMDPQEIRSQTVPRAIAALARAVEQGQLTGRGHDRCLRVARTIADLAASDRVDQDHVDEAIAHRFALTNVRRVDAHTAAAS